MKTLARAFIDCCRHGWRALRALTGDDAYERYLAHARRHHPSHTPMSPSHTPMSAAVFYRSEQERRWSSGPNRCC
jgi:uncharacterized short protein YbdD (DUF466 family)